MDFSSQPATILSLAVTELCILDRVSDLLPARAASTHWRLTVESVLPGALVILEHEPAAPNVAEDPDDDPVRCWGLLEQAPRLRLHIKKRFDLSKAGLGRLRKSMEWLCPPAGLKLDLCKPTPSQLIETLHQFQAMKVTELRIRDFVCRPADRQDLRRAVRCFGGPACREIIRLEFLRERWLYMYTEHSPNLHEIIPLCVAFRSLQSLALDLSCTELIDCDAMALDPATGHSPLPERAEKCLQLSALGALPNLREFELLGSVRPCCDPPAFLSGMLCSTANAFCSLRGLERLKASTFVFHGEDDGEDADALANMLLSLPKLQELDELIAPCLEFWHALRARQAECAASTLRKLCVDASQCSDEELKATVEGVRLLPALQHLVVDARTCKHSVSNIDQDGIERLFSRLPQTLKVEFCVSTTDDSDDSDDSGDSDVPLMNLVQTGPAGHRAL